MSRSAASRSAAEAAAKFAALPGAVKMSDCPVCTFPIYSNQKTAWRSVNDKPARIHQGCTP